MLLPALNELYDRLTSDPAYEIARPGYSLQKITFKVVLTEGGELVGLHDLRRVVKGTPKPQQLIVPGGGKPSGAVTKSSVAKKVLPLRNDMPFLVGLRVESEPTPHLVLAERGEFAAFREYHVGAEQDVGDPHFSAVCRLLENWRPEEGLAHEEWVEFGSGQGVFQILGAAEYVHERKAVQEWWERMMSSEDAGDRGQCLITGAVAPLARLHHMFKGVRGANTSGASIVSFNQEAFESNGLKQGLNAPVSETAVFRYGTALNALLDGPMKEKHRVFLGETTLAFWTDRPSPVEDIFAAYLSLGSIVPKDSAPQDEAVRSKLEIFLRALREGWEAHSEIAGEKERRFFLVGLSGNAGRGVVRFFQAGRVGEMLARLRLHHRQIEVVAMRAGDPEIPPAWVLLDQACPQRQGRVDRDGLPPHLPAALLRAILTGEPYPVALYQAVLRRLVSGEEMTYARACIVKGVLSRNFGKEVPVSLDVGRTEPSYLVGRLFAALEKTQQDALGRGLNRTIRDSFYASASSTPAVVFPRLLRLYQHHIGKLDGGLRVMRDRLVQEIVGPLGAFPRHLGLVEQGMFALGYYHQMQAFYTPRVAEAAESALEG